MLGKMVWALIFLRVYIAPDRRYSLSPVIRDEGEEGKCMASVPISPIGNWALTWYGRAVLFGAGVNVALALAVILAPDTVFRLVGFQPASPSIWPRFAGLLLILLTVFYVFPALKPVERRGQAIWTIGCRVAGVAFFLIAGGPYILFAGIDFVFGVPQAILLGRGLVIARRATG